jgi:hypothetical protein
MNGLAWKNSRHICREVMAIVKAIDKIMNHARRHHDMLRHATPYFAKFTRDVSTINEMRLHHPDILKKARAVEIAVYKIKGYMRLVPFNDLLVGTYKSEHLVFDLVGLHFAKRYPACHVVTWNEARNEGCFTFSEIGQRSQDVRDLLASHHVNQAMDRDLLVHGCLHHFSLAREDTFQHFVACIAAVLYPEIYGDFKATFDRHEFDAAWKAFYDTQAIDSRVNYQRALKMLGKKHLLDQLGQGSIEAQRVLKKIPPRGQKPLF